MAIAQKLERFLKENKIKYESIEHRVVYTAQDKAKTLRASEKTVGKTLVLRTGKDLTIVLIPANRNLDKNKFKKVAKAKTVDFVSERIIKNKLKGVKVGAIPPFGVLWKIPTFVDRALFNQSKIIVNAGNWNCSIKLNLKIFKKIIPDLIIGNFSKLR